MSSDYAKQIAVHIYVQCRRVDLWVYFFFFSTVTHNSCVLFALYLLMCA